jgi:hypothetical protein
MNEIKQTIQDMKDKSIKIWKPWKIINLNFKKLHIPNKYHNQKLGKQSEASWK